MKKLKIQELKLKIANIAKKIQEKIKINRKSVALLIILFVLGDFFYWQCCYKTPPDKWDNTTLNESEYYEINEIDGQKIIENKRVGISFRIAKEWRVEIPSYGNYLALFSPNAIGAANHKQGIKQGCQITVNIILAKTDIKTIEQQLKDIHQNWNYPEIYEITSVAKHQALKNLTGIPALGLYGTTIHIPVTKLFNQSKIYYLGVSSNSQDKEICKQEFEKFLQTVVIK